MMKMRITDEGRKRLYLTRHMWASENEVYIEPNSVEAVRALGYAEDPPSEDETKTTLTGRPRGRPRKEPAKAEEQKLEDKTVPELREMAEEKGIELPSGYIKKDELVDLVTAADDDDESMTYGGVEK